MHPPTPALAASDVSALRCAQRRRVRGWSTKGLIAIAYALTSFSLGCAAVGPDYVPPGTRSLRAQYSQRAVAEHYSQPFEQWWDQLFDPMLAELATTALNQNLPVQESNWRICEARAVAGVVNGQLFPYMDSIGSYTYRKRSLNARSNAVSNGAPFDVFSVGFDSRWEIDIFGRIRRETEAAVAEWGASIEASEDLKRILVAEVAATYVAIRTRQELLRVIAENQQSQAYHRWRAESRFRAGMVGRLDVVQAEQVAEATAAELPLIEQELRLSFHQLYLLLGQTPDGSLEQRLGRSPIPTPNLIEVGVPADLLRRRPDVRRAEREVVAASALIGVATSELYPRLTLNGAITLDSRNFSSLVEYDILAFGLGPGIRWNVLSLGRIQQSIQAREAAYQQAVLRYQQSVIVAAGEVENAIAQYSYGQQRVELLDRTVRTAQEAMQLAIAQYGAGVVGLERVLSAQRRLLEAQQRLVESRSEVALAAIRTYKAAGGGWNNSPVPTPAPEGVQEGPFTIRRLPNP